jgi:hypothetical protein
MTLDSKIFYSISADTVMQLPELLLKNKKVLKERNHALFNLNGDSVLV